MMLAELILPLAQADAPPADFGPWLANAMYVILSAAGVVGLLVGIKQLREKPAETPQPLMVQQHAEFVHKPDFDKAMREAHGRIGRERVEVNAALTKIETGHAAATVRLDAELSAVREQLVDNNKAGEARVVALHARINSLPSEIISLLRSTKGLLE